VSHAGEFQKETPDFNDGLPPPDKKRKRLIRLSLDGGIMEGDRQLMAFTDADWQARRKSRAAKRSHKAIFKTPAIALLSDPLLRKLHANQAQTHAPRRESAFSSTSSRHSSVGAVITQGLKATFPEMMRARSAPGAFRGPRRRRRRVRNGDGGDEETLLEEEGEGDEEEEEEEEEEPSRPNTRGFIIGGFNKEAFPLFGSVPSAVNRVVLEKGEENSLPPPGAVRGLTLQSLRVCPEQARQRREFKERLQSLRDRVANKRVKDSQQQIKARFLDDVMTEMLSLLGRQIEKRCVRRTVLKEPLGVRTSCKACRDT
jgi:hypothetical protein